MKQKTTEHGKLKIIPLGGLEQIGMNITAFEYEDNIIVVDCGLSFPEDDKREGLVSQVDNFCFLQFCSLKRLFSWDCCHAI